MTATAEYLPYLSRDDVFVSGILGRVIGANHVVIRDYRKVSMSNRFSYLFAPCQQIKLITCPRLCVQVTVLS